MTTRPAISLVTLGVADVERSAAFYERLGARGSGASVAGTIAFLELGTVALALFEMTAMLEDAGLPEGAGASPGAFALARNVVSREAVDRVMAEAEEAGATVVQPASAKDWGGYAGYFADPDGHRWEIAWNPHFPLGVDGKVTLPD